MTHGHYVEFYNLGLKIVRVRSPKPSIYCATLTDRGGKLSTRILSSQVLSATWLLSFCPPLRRSLDGWLPLKAIHHWNP
jgi:hypothetical protein